MSGFIPLLACTQFVHRQGPLARLERCARCNSSMLDHLKRTTKREKQERRRWYMLRDLALVSLETWRLLHRVESMLSVAKALKRLHGRGRYFGATLGTTSVLVSASGAHAYETGLRRPVPEPPKISWDTEVFSQRCSEDISKLGKMIHSAVVLAASAAYPVTESDSQPTSSPQLEAARSLAALCEQCGAEVASDRPNAEAVVDWLESIVDDLVSSEKKLGEEEEEETSGERKEAEAVSPRASFKEVPQFRGFVHLYPVDGNSKNPNSALDSNTLLVWGPDEDKDDEEEEEGLEHESGYQSEDSNDSHFPPPAEPLSLRSEGLLLEGFDEEEEGGGSDGEVQRRGRLGGRSRSDSMSLSGRKRVDKKLFASQARSMSPPRRGLHNNEDASLRGPDEETSNKRSSTPLSSFLSSVAATSPTSASSSPALPSDAASSSPWTGPLMGANTSDLTQNRRRSFRRLNSATKTQFRSSWQGSRNRARSVGVPSPVQVASVFSRQDRLSNDEAASIVVNAEALMRKESNVVELSATKSKRVIVLGDIHGQFFDLIFALESAGYPLSSSASPSIMSEATAPAAAAEEISEDLPTLLFLGDYVDRGAWSCEVLLFVLTLKVARPTSVFLLRGNHEASAVVSFFGFKEEMEVKYGTSLFRRCTSCFQAMPLAAVVTNSLGKRWLCLHGGLSPRLTTLEDIHKVDRFAEPAINGLFCDLLWSDPAPEEMREDFAANPSRGCSVRFGKDATSRFLDANRLEGLLRGHEVVQDGVATAFEGRVVTVFSAPNYCGRYANRAAWLELGEETEPWVVAHRFDPAPGQPEPVTFESVSLQTLTSISTSCPYMPTTLHGFVSRALRLWTAAFAPEDEQAPPPPPSSHSATTPSNPILPVLQTPERAHHPPTGLDSASSASNATPLSAQKFESAKLADGINEAHPTLTRYKLQSAEFQLKMRKLTLLESPFKDKLAVAALEAGHQAAAAAIERVSPSSADARKVLRLLDEDEEEDEESGDEAGGKGRGTTEESLPPAPPLLLRPRGSALMARHASSSEDAQPSSAASLELLPQAESLTDPSAAVSASPRLRTRFTSTSTTTSGPRRRSSLGSHPATPGTPSHNEDARSLSGSQPGTPSHPTTAAAPPPQQIDFTESELRSIQLLFMLVDRSDDGFLEPREIVAWSLDEGEAVSEEDAVKVVQAVDADGDGRIGLDDFLWFSACCKQTFEESLKEEAAAQRLQASELSLEPPVACPL